MQTIVTDTMQAHHLNGNRISMTLSDAQLLKLIETLKEHIPTIENSNDGILRKAREFFFEKEGYMQTDKICLTYWNDYKESK